MVAPPNARNPQAVLFACGFNSVRSPMAESLLQQMFPQALYVKSAGVKKGELDPFAVAVMAELGQDISGHKPMTFEELEDWEGLNFDLIITLSPEAHHKALALTHTLAADVEYWPTPDPTTTEGISRAEAGSLSRGLRRAVDAHPPAVFQGGRGERVADLTFPLPRAGEGAERARRWGSLRESRSTGEPRRSIPFQRKRPVVRERTCLRRDDEGF